MKIFLAFSIFLISAVTAANDSCETNRSVIAAQYAITVSKQGKKVGESSFSLWRYNNSVLHQNENNELSTLWYKSGEASVKKTRLFDHHKRGIEYDREKMLDNSKWFSISNLVSENELEHMDKISTVGKGCEQIIHFKKAGKEIWWQPSLSLIKKMKLTKDNKNVVWHRENIIFDQSLIKDTFAKVSKYQMTDFADIGDNESDPFLNKMINLGFIEHGSSGFYDSQGHALQGGHHH